MRRQTLALDTFRGETPESRIDIHVPIDIVADCWIVSGWMMTVSKQRKTHSIKGTNSVHTMSHPPFFEEHSLLLPL
jgi:hypothetical protein